jgi:hypothetical protein
MHLNNTIILHIPGSKYISLYAGSNESFSLAISFVTDNQTIAFCHSNRKEINNKNIKVLPSKHLEIYSLEWKGGG